MNENEKYNIGEMLHESKLTGKKLGRDYWRGNDLQMIMNMPNKKDFDYLVAKAKMECEKIKVDPNKHITTYSRLISARDGRTWSEDDWALSRLACYFTVRSAVRSDISGIMENYFLGNGKTLEQFLEDKERVIIRPRITSHHKLLSRADARSGVDSRLEHALLGQATAKGLYDMEIPELREYRNLGDENIYDHMGKTELAVNDEVIMDTNHRLRELDPGAGFRSARYVHEEAAHDMRDDILFRGYRGGTMPEHLPVAAKTPRQLVTEDNRAIKELTKQ